MSPQEWDALPWWLSRAYLEGLEAELTGEPFASDEESDDGVPAPRSEPSADADELGSRGFKLRVVK